MYRPAFSLFTLLSAVLMTIGFGGAAHASYEVRVKSIMCLKPASGIERGVVKGLRIFTQAAGSTLSTVGPIVSLAGPKAKVGLAAAETSIAAIRAGASVASAIDRRRDPDDLYLKIGGSKIWPRGKYKSMRGGQERRPNLRISPVRGNRYSLTLMEYDSGSGDDFLGKFSFTPTRSGTFTVDVRSKKEDSAYLVEIEVIDRTPRPVPSNVMSRFRYAPRAAISGHNREKFHGSPAQCAQACLQRSWCRSFDMNRAKGTCDLSDATAASVGGLKRDYPDHPYDHYHRR